jgi:hypothetical protein
MMLRGRGQQCVAVDQLLARVRAGRSQVLVVRGEPGIGKTVLLGYAVDTVHDFQVARTEGVESEMELPYAALQQLCSRMLSRLDVLPGPQQDALGVAFGLGSGRPPDRFLVGLAVLGLLSDAAAERPLLCLVDDAQWLDQASAQVLAFIARRLDAESVAMLFGARDLAATGDLAGLPALALHGLADADARVLLASVLPGRLDEPVRDRIIAEASGNPLALLELPRGVTATQLAGGFGVAAAVALSGRIEDSFRRRLAPLTEETLRLLLLAAAEPVGDPALLWRAAGQLGIGIEGADAAEREGLLTLGARVTFRHPLVRSAIYRAGSLRQRREVYWALAAATDPQLDPDRRAWHLAQAAAGPDEDVAAELERSAGRAQARGGLAAASDAPPLLLKAAARLAPLDAGLARETYLEALSAARYAGRFTATGGLREAAEAVAAAPPAAQPPSAPDLLLDGLARVITQGRAASAPTLKRALNAFRSEHMSTEGRVRWLWLASPAAHILWDDESWHLLSTRHVQLARDAGALGVLPMALSQSAGVRLYQGDFAAAASLITEAAAIAEATGSQLPPYAPLALAAFRGRARTRRRWCSPRGRRRR